MPYDVKLAWGQFVWSRQNIHATPYIANNADCIKETLTSAYWGSDAKMLGLSILTTALVLFA